MLAFDVAALIAEILSSEGHTVDTARNGLDALDKIAAAEYELILTDMRMPGLDGPGLYREAVRLRPDLAARFVLMTGDTLSPETREFLERTAAPTLSKPADVGAVEQVVRRALAALRQTGS